MKIIVSIIILASILNSDLVYSQSNSKKDILVKGFCDEAQKLLVEFKYSEALKRFEECNSKDKYLKQIADCSFKLGDYNKAKLNYNKLLNFDSTNILVLNQLASIYLNESNYLESIKYYNKLVTIDSTNSYYYSQLGTLYKRSENIPVSIVYFNKALELNSKNIQVINELAFFYMKLGIYPKADSLINIGIAIDSNNIRLLTTGSKTLYRQQKYDSVVSVINHIIRIKKDTSSLLLRLLATTNFHLKKYEKAVELLDKIVEDGDNSEIIYYFLAKAYLEKGENDKSIFYFNKALEKGVSDNASSYYYNIAFLQDREEKYIEAIKSYKEAYYFSKDKVLLYKIAKNYDLAYKDKKPALRYYKKYIKLNDTNNKEFVKYSKRRIVSIKEELHFKNINK